MRPGFCIIASLVLSAGLAHAQGSAQSQVLKDQFGRDARVDLGQGKPLVLLVSDRRDSPKDFHEWASLLESLPRGFRLQALAKLKAVPFFVPKEAVASSTRRDLPSLPVLLDWKGTVSEALATPHNLTAVMVFSPSGRQVGIVEAKASAAALAEVAHLLAVAASQP